jgi:hypothetical protein
LDATIRAQDCHLYTSKISYGFKVPYYTQDRYLCIDPEQVPDELRQQTLASLIKDSRIFNDSDLTQQFATLQYERVQVVADHDTQILPYSRVDDLKAHSSIIRSNQGSRGGAEIRGDALIHFLSRALAGQQINVLAFDQQSFLSKWTVADFQKLVASQKGLRVVVIPRYAIESAQTTIVSNFTGQ